MSGKHSKLMYINNYISGKSDVSFEVVTNDDITKFVKLYKEIKYIVTLISNGSVTELTEHFSIITQIYYHLISTIENYDTFLNSFNENDIISFFKELAKNDRENASKIGKPLFDIIKKFKKGKIDNNIFKKILDFQDVSELVIVTNNRRDILFNDLNLDIISPKEYLSSEVYYNKETIVFIGTPSYFPNEISNVFKANHIIFLSYDIYLNSLNTHKIIPYSSDDLSKITGNVTFDNTEISNLETKEILESFPEEISFNLATSNRFKKDLSNPNQNPTQANVLSFISGYYAWYPIGAKPLQLNPKTMGIKATTLNELPEGAWIIHRESEGDVLKNYVISKIGDEKYSNMLSDINVFRSELRKRITSYGIENVIKQLRNSGISVSSEQTILNWLDSVIRPHSMMYVMLDYLEFDKETAKRIYQSARDINTYHKMAGRSLQADMKTLFSNLSDKKIIKITQTMKEKKYYTARSKKLGRIRIERIEHVYKDIVEISAQDLYVFKKGGA